METTKLACAAAALGVALSLSACSSSSDSGGGGGSDELSLPGDWSGEFADTHQTDPLFAHSPSGAISITFEEDGGVVSGDIVIQPDPCDDSSSDHDSKPETTGTITGTLDGSDLEFTYDTPMTSTEEVDNAVTVITFVAEFIESAQVFQGTYDANACSPVSLNWDGQFTLTQD